MTRALTLVLGFALAVLLGASYENLADINGRLLVSQNLPNGHRTLLKFGFNTDVDDVEESVSEVVDATGAGLGPDRCILDTTVIPILSISSDDANDAGLEITVEGLDLNWDAYSVTQALGVAGAVSGTVFTSVGDPTKWLRVNRAFVSDSTATQGVVYIHSDLADTGSDGIPDDPTTQVRAVINAAEQQTLHACYTTPDDYASGLHISQWCASNLTGGAGNAADLRLRSTTEAGVSRTQSLFSIANGATFCERYDPPRMYPPRTALELTAITAAANSNGNVAGTVNGYLLR